MHRPHAFVELHIEQGPVLAADGITIGAVEDLQGIRGRRSSSPASRITPGPRRMRLRHDAGYCAAAIAGFLRQLARDMGGAQVCTVGRIELVPNLINVIASRAKLTADLRNTDEALLQAAEARLAAFLESLASDEGVTIQSRRLARFEPVIFAPAIVECIERGRRAAWFQPETDDVGRRARRPDAGPHLPVSDDLRAQRRRHQPQRG
jgi:N-carbamoyl-L-amino-acid hydrolase